MERETEATNYLVRHYGPEIDCGGDTTVKTEDFEDQAALDDYIDYMARRFPNVRVLVDPPNGYRGGVYPTDKDGDWDWVTWQRFWYSRWEDWRYERSIERNATENRKRWDCRHGGLWVIRHYGVSGQVEWDACSEGWLASKIRVEGNCFEPSCLIAECRLFIHLQDAKRYVEECIDAELVRPLGKWRRPISA